VSREIGGTAGGPTAEPTLAAEKVAQAVDVLEELGVDCWLTFVRETTESGDPVLPLILGQELTWPSALIVTRRGLGGDRIAIVGRHEDDSVARSGAWPEIVAYVEGVSGPLRTVLDRLDPASIAVNTSVNDVKADGLTHGMWELLHRYLAGTPFAERLTSAERVVAAVRGRKTPRELERIRGAIAVTDAIYREVAARVRPGMTELAVSELMHGLADERGVPTAWDRAQCPIVTTGPDSSVGHALPSPELTVRPGMVFHLDFGVIAGGYCSDVQRSWYVPSPGAPEPSASIADAFDAVRASILAAKAALRPGVPLWTVDEAARSTLVARGWPEYAHGTGHQVGRAAHDGGGLACPRWERYGDAPLMPAEVGQVFTLELGVEHPDAGYVALEEMVRVTDDGCDWLTRPQESLWRLGEPREHVC
jgi:Xaa-Pro aminopeptidase